MNTSGAPRQRQVLFLVLITFLPSVALYGYAARTLKKTELKAAEQHLLHAARGIAAQHDQNLRETRSLLSALSEVPELQDATRGSCNALLARALVHTPQYTTLSVVGGDGFLACGSILAGDELYLGDRAYFTRATVGNRPAIGEFAIGRITGKAGLGVAVPLPGPRPLPSILAATIDLTRIGLWAEAVELPDDASLTLLDQERRVLIRRSELTAPTAVDSVGSTVPDAFPSAPADFEAVLADGLDLDGSQRRFGVIALHGDGGQPVGFLAVGRRRDTLEAAASRVFQTELALLGFTALAMLAAASVIAHLAFRARDEQLSG